MKERWADSLRRKDSLKRPNTKARAALSPRSFWAKRTALRRCSNTSALVALLPCTRPARGRNLAWLHERRLPTVVHLAWWLSRRSSAARSTCCAHAAQHDFAAEIQDRRSWHVGRCQQRTIIADVLRRANRCREEPPGTSCQKGKARREMKAKSHAPGANGPSGAAERNATRICHGGTFSAAERPDRRSCERTRLRRAIRRGCRLFELAARRQQTSQL